MLDSVHDAKEAPQDALTLPDRALGLCHLQQQFVRSRAAYVLAIGVIVGENRGNQ